MAENFSNLDKKMDLELHEVQRVPNKEKPKRSIPGHIIIKKVKERISNSCKQLTVSSKTMSRFFSRNLAGQKRVA